MGYPKEFECPITLDVMFDPVVAADGRSYERHAIEAYFKTARPPIRSPIKRTVLANTALFPNDSLRILIQEHASARTKARDAAEDFKRLGLQPAVDIEEDPRTHEPSRAPEGLQAFLFGLQPAVDIEEDPRTHEPGRAPESLQAFLFAESFFGSVGGALVGGVTAGISAFIIRGFSFDRCLPACMAGIIAGALPMGPILLTTRYVCGHESLQSREARQEVLVGAFAATCMLLPLTNIIGSAILGTTGMEPINGAAESALIGAMSIPLMLVPLACTRVLVQFAPEPSPHGRID